MGRHQDASDRPHDASQSAAAQVDAASADATAARTGLVATESDGTESDPTESAAAESDPTESAGNAADRAGPRAAVSHLLIGILCALLGFGIVVQVQRVSEGDTLSTARPQDLVAILDGLQRRSDDLTAEIAELQKTLATLRSGGASSAAALAEAQRRSEALAILAGTAVAVGPGIRMTINDPNQGIPPEVLLAALQELRNAGAEAVQVNNVRIGVDSAFTGTLGQITLDGTALTAPYVILAIGDPPTMSAAMNIPGGVSDTVTRATGSMEITPLDVVTVDALRVPAPNTYAQPAGG